MDLFSGCSGNDFETVLAEIEKEMSMADVMTELGYGCTIDTSHCKEMLSLFQPLNDVAQLLVLIPVLKMPRTHMQHSVQLLVAAQQVIPHC